MPSLTRLSLLWDGVDTAIRASKFDTELHKNINLLHLQIIENSTKMYVDKDLSQECSESLKSMEEDSNIFDNSIEFDTIERSDIAVGKPVGYGSFNSVRTILNELPSRKRTDAISKGAFSNVKKSTSEKYALKRIRSDLSDSMLYTGVIDLAKEAIFLAALSHPNIVKLHSAANNPGNY